MSGISTPRLLQITPLSGATQGQPGMLIVQAEAQTALRWSWMNVLGAPYARQVLENKVWRNDGFLPPNAQARLLFSGLIFAWSDDAEVGQRFGTTAGVQRSIDERTGDIRRTLIKKGVAALTVVVPADAKTQTFQLILPDGMTWQVAPLPNQPSTHSLGAKR